MTTRRGLRRRRTGGGRGRASPAAKLVMAALCLLWVIPTAGIVVTSFRTIFGSFMARLPRAVMESARVDGASHYQIFWRERQVVTVTLGGLIGGNRVPGWQVVTGGALITMAVPVLAFVLLQCSLVRGLAAGSVNG